ncbi:hypothetical protein G6F56_009401 [Rhizopus delemar]|nr:hypothetical protein G6F56_009401 [Rhizopus delemar]
MTNEKPNVLVLGGVGFIGRHFIYHLIQNELTGYIRVVDKAVPETAHFSQLFLETFEQVDFKQLDLVNPDSIASCFEDMSFDYVFNFAGETKTGQDEEIYQGRILDLSVHCAQEAAKHDVKLFMEMSTAQVYEDSVEPSTESSEIKPWTDVAKYKYKAEKELMAIEGLNLLIVRPALVYGPGALSGLTTRLILGRIHKYLNDNMKCFWSKDLKLNTVHVRDVSKACWHLAEWYVDHHESDEIPIFNLRVVNEHLESIFNIGVKYHNHLVSTLAKIDLAAVVEGENEKHLGPWEELLEENEVKSTPLTPFIKKDDFHDHSLSIDGSKIEQTGFDYQIPTITDENLIEIIEEFKALNLWPKNDIQ